jgi:uncharacterized protein YqeY
MVLTAIKNEEVSGKEARELSDAEVITVLSREAKKRREAAEDLISATIAETGASGPQQMGLVMKSIQPKIAGRADGGLVSSLVKAALSGGN